MIRPALVLIIGEKNYANWSLGPWLLLQHFNINFEEINISLAPPNVADRLADFSPTEKVPVLMDQGHVIWDSLAIMEYVSEHFLKNTGWPDQRYQRAQARSLCAEVHSGFTFLQQQLPMNVRQTRRVTLGERAKQELQRIDTIWSECASQSATGWLFDQFGIADCYFAQFAFMFQTYQLPLSEGAKQYQQKLLSLQAFRQWQQDARRESTVIKDNEVGIEII